MSHAGWGGVGHAGVGVSDLAEVLDSPPSWPLQRKT